jgi:hypothetical protein
MTISIAELAQFKALAVADYPPDRWTFYSPVDDVHGALKAVLASAQHKIIVAVYGFDDEELSAILLDKMRSDHARLFPSRRRPREGGACGVAGSVDRHAGHVGGVGGPVGAWGDHAPEDGGGRRAPGREGLDELV